MNTFPYDTWAEALEASAASGGADGYFTWGPGGNTASFVLAFLGIALALLWSLWIIQYENKELSEAAHRLNDKWGI